MKTGSISCDDMGIKMMALIDGELGENEINEVRKHLEICDRCSTEYTSLKKVKEVAGEMKFKKMPEFYWDEYWEHIYNRIERGLSWLFISLGAIIVLSFAGWEFINELLADPQIHPLLKAGIFILMIGLAILIVSILREKIMIRRIDKYKEIER